MQKTFQPITPQKKALSLFPSHDDLSLKELSPMFLTVTSSNFGKVKL